jgi:oligoribonuclease
VADLLVWIDCEMTGLDLGKDKLIEVAALVTDPELNVLGEGVDLVIHADDAVRRSSITMAEAEAVVLAYVKEFVPNPRTAPLCGNSIATDRGFLARDMPTLDSYLHYRMIDVSSIKELTRRWYPRVYFGQPAKGLAHRALADIRESIRELEYYRRTVFVPQPGPDVDAAKAIAAEL